MSKYTTTTAALKATTIDARKITAKSLEIEKADGSKQDIVDLIEDVAESIPTGIGVGTQSQPFDDSTPETGFMTGVNKINFKGKFVNVIKTANAGEVTLWIQENKSEEPYDKVTQPGGTSYVMYDTDDYTMPVTAGTSTTVHQVVAEGTNFSSVTMAAVNTAGEAVCSTAAENSIWFRVNGGTVASQALIKSTTQDPTTKENIHTPFIGTKIQDNVTLNISANSIWHNADAEDGKVPGQCEISFKFTAALASIIPNGGKVVIEYGVSKTQPTTWQTLTLVASKYNNPAITGAKATLKTASTITVSGINYLSSGSIYDVTATSITNTQHKIGNTTNRLRISGASGTSKNYTASTKNVANTAVALTRTDADKDNANSSAAVFSYADTYTTGAAGTPGSNLQISLNASKHTDTGNPSGAGTNITLSDKFWGVSRSASNDTYELFMQENKRTDSAMTAITSFDASKYAVVQNGKLYHAASSTYKTGYSGGTDGTGRWATSSTGNKFSRIFKNTSTDTCASLTIAPCNASGNAITNDATFMNLARNGKIKITLRGINSSGALESATWNCGKYASETGSDPVVGMLKETKNNALVCTVAGLAFQKSKGCLIEIEIVDSTAVVPPFRVDLV